MQYTRIYSDAQGETHFEDIQVPLHDHGMIGYLSENYPVQSIQFRESPPDYDWSFHNAPTKQFVILLDGEIEITTSLGVCRQFKGGDILLVEDITGKGHKSKHIKQNVRRSIFIKL